MPGPAPQCHVRSALNKFPMPLYLRLSAAVVTVKTPIFTAYSTTLSGTEYARTQMLYIPTLSKTTPPTFWLALTSMFPLPLTPPPPTLSIEIYGAKTKILANTIHRYNCTCRAYMSALSSRLSPPLPNITAQSFWGGTVHYHRPNNIRIKLALYIKFFKVSILIQHLPSPQGVTWHLNLVCYLCNALFIPNPTWFAPHDNVTLEPYSSWAKPGTPISKRPSV